MQVYALIGALVLLLGFVVFIALRWSRLAVGKESAENRAAARKAEARRKDEVRAIERDLREAADWDNFRPTTDRNLAPPRASGSTKVIVKRPPSASVWLASAFLALAISTGCTRVVPVGGDCPEIPVGPDLPKASEPNWDALTWEDYARRLRAAVDQYNAEVTSDAP